MIRTLNFISFLTLAFFITGCNNNLSTPSLEITGVYKSFTYITPGPTDGGEDIQAAGGYLNIKFADDYTFTAESYEPPSAPRSHSGTFTIKADTIVFVSDNFYLSHIQWIRQHKQLETFEVPMRGRPYKIILNKYSL